jgi:putative addiction module component (TIGR02574 family)
MNANLRKLPLDERIRLVEDLWDSLAADQSLLPLTPEQRAELDRRLDAYESDGNAGRPAEDVIADKRDYEADRPGQGRGGSRSGRSCFMVRAPTGGSWARIPGGSAFRFPTRCRTTSDIPIIHRNTRRAPMMRLMTT